MIKPEPIVIRRLGFLITSVLLMFSVACNNEVYLSNPLYSIKNDLIVGRWASEDGNLAVIIQRGSGDSYSSWSPSDYAERKAPTTFYMAEAGDMLFVEEHADCNGHKFRAPESPQTPTGCWAVTRIVLSGTNLAYYPLDAVTIIKTSLSGTLHIANSYGVVASKDDSSPLAEILLQGTSEELSGFLATFARGAIYSQPRKLHRI